jgi:hypothetical protein
MGRDEAGPGSSWGAHWREVWTAGHGRDHLTHWLIYAVVIPTVMTIGLAFLAIHPAGKALEELFRAAAPAALALANIVAALAVPELPGVYQQLPPREGARYRSLLVTGGFFYTGVALAAGVYVAALRDGDWFWRQILWYAGTIGLGSAYILIKLHRGITAVNEGG